jgi:hypothetical protein
MGTLDHLSSNSGPKLGQFGDIESMMLRSELNGNHGS